MERLEDKTTEEIKAFKEEAAKDRREAARRFEAREKRLDERINKYTATTDERMKRFLEKAENDRKKGKEETRQQIEDYRKETNRQIGTIKWATGLVLVAIISYTGYTTHERDKYHK